MIAAICTTYRSVINARQSVQLWPSKKKGVVYSVLRTVWLTEAAPERKARTLKRNQKWRPHKINDRIRSTSSSLSKVPGYLGTQALAAYLHVGITCSYYCVDGRQPLGLCITPNTVANRGQLVNVDLRAATATAERQKLETVAFNAHTQDQPIRGCVIAIIAAAQPTQTDPRETGASPFVLPE